MRHVHEGRGIVPPRNRRRIGDAGVLYMWLAGKMLTQRPQIFLGGRWVSTAESFPVRNPADVKDVLAEAPCARTEHVTEAVDIARRAFPAWRSASPLHRGSILQAAARLIVARQAELAELLSREIGKLSHEAQGEVRKTADFFSYYGSLGRGALGEVLAHDGPSSEVTVRREPRGVTILITPWNDPLLTAARKACPALLAGNTLILKPAPEAPLSSLALASLLEEAGLPAGVLSVLTGSDDEIGKALVAADVDAISFTGSTEVGLAIQRAVVGRTTAVQAEMGGKNAAVVLGDADLTLAVEAITDGALAQAGQRCTATSRLLVTQDCYPQLLERLRARVAGITVGPASVRTNTMGPLISGARRDYIVECLSAADLHGATTVCEGRPLEKHRNGHFLTPALVADTPLQSRVWSEELFGPVLAVRLVDDLDEALEEINSSPYGLSAALFTRDLSAARHFSDVVQVGCVAVNLPTAGWDVHVPFGGVKLSGSGGGEQGEQGLRFYSRLKAVAVRATYQAEASDACR